MTKRNQFIKIVIGINVVVFLISQIIEISPLLYIHKQSLFSINAYISMVVSAFSHVTIIHLTMNMIFLYYFAEIITSQISEKNFIKLFIFTLFFSGILTTLLIDSNTILLGASGIGYGLLGFEAFWLYNYDKYYTKEAKKSIFSLIAVNVVFSIIVPNVSVLGHFTGFLGGVIFCIIFIKVSKNKHVLQKFDIL